MTARRISLFIAFHALCVIAGLAGPITFPEHIRPVLEKYCVDCHNPEKEKGDLNLVPLLEKPNVPADRKVWEKVAELIESREMPPEKKAQPSNEQRELVTKFIDGQLSIADCAGPRNPGRVTIRRLNREEYHNTIRDLLGVEYVPEEFPPDEVGYGFDNIGDVLSLSPLLMEKYLAAAEEIVGKAIRLDAVPKPFVQRLKGDAFHSANDWIRPLESSVLGLYREGEGAAQFNVPTSGVWVIRVRAFGDQAGPAAPRMKLAVDGRELRVFDVPNEKSANYEASVNLDVGAHTVTVAYLNNYNVSNSPDPKLRGDRNLFVSYVEFEGPPGPAPALPDSHKRLIARMPKPGEERAVAHELLADFARRAYRRPVTEDEVARLAHFVDLSIEKGGGFLEGMQIAVQAAICSPHFLFRWELDPIEIKPGDIRELSDYEVASRLSYFLWRSMPDTELATLASQGMLRKDGNLEKQTARMLKDWHARSFYSDFVGQWLQIRNIWDVGLDPGIFKKWNDSLKGAMKEEAELFFQAVATEDRPVTDLLAANFTFLNEKLAEHYGIKGVQGEKFQRVDLPDDSPRGGVLTMGSVLVSTSTPTRTAPVIRGKWILEQILGTPPPPPPPNVPPLGDQSPVNQTASLRQRLEEHASRAECAGCHKRMDPLGFALENFDATGAWRDADGKFPIDSTGKLPSGISFTGPRDLKAALKTGNRFARSFTEKLLIYALGRGLDHYDRCAVDAVLTRAGGNESRFAALVSGIVTSDPFLKRRASEVAAQ